MAFVTVDLAEAIDLDDEAGADQSPATETALNDGSTATEANAEIREDKSGYKITHDLGFPVGNLASLSIRVFDGIISSTGNAKIYPYQSDDVNVTSGNQATLAINDNGAYDTAVLSAGFIADLQDVGTNQISIRVAAEDAGGLRGLFTEIEIEFADGGAPRRVMVIS